MIKDEWLVTAEMASLELNSDEIENLAREASEMNDLFELLAGAMVDDLEPTTHALISGNFLREDVVRSFDDSEKLHEASPELEDGFFLIPNLL